MKADLPMESRRQQQRAAVCTAIVKKPATEPTLPVRKRTPFTLKREGSLVVGGSKLKIFRGHTATLKRPAASSSSLRKRPAGHTAVLKRPSINSPSIRKRPAARSG